MGDTDFTAVGNGADGHFVDIRLWRADALMLFDWLMQVDLERVPVQHPAQRQALADLFGRLGEVLDVPSRAQLDQARRQLETQATAD